MAQIGTLTTNQRRAIDALLSTTTTAAAAKACGLGTRTVFRYLADPVFREALRERESAARGQTTAALLGGAGLALQTLVAVMGDKEATDSAKVAASRVWLAATDRGVESDVIIARVEELERLYGDR